MQRWTLGARGSRSQLSWTAVSLLCMVRGGVRSVPMLAGAFAPSPCSPAHRLGWLPRPARIQSSAAGGAGREGRRLQMLMGEGANVVEKKLKYPQMWMFVPPAALALQAWGTSGWTLAPFYQTTVRPFARPLAARRGLCCLRGPQRRWHCALRLPEDPAAKRNAVVAERLAPERFREVNEFYRANRYKATCRPSDTLWVLREPATAALVGAVRLTPQRFKPFGALLFLRSLCVARDWRRQGLGTQLTRAATADDPGTPHYCFALEELIPLYLQAGWHMTPPEAMPPTILHRFEAVVQQTARKHKKVALLSHGLPAGQAAGGARAQDDDRGRVRIVLLQHVNEVRRATATGQVLAHESLRPHLQLERWVWRGRADNAIIHDLLASRTDTCVLVWAEAPRAQAASGEPSPSTSCGGSKAAPGETAAYSLDKRATYIILDGTWQEARNMFRKCPSLHSLPRVALPGQRKP